MSSTTAASCICVFVMLSIGFILPITMIALGAPLLHECPMQPWIPKFLIVGGVTGIVFSISLFFFVYGCEVEACTKKLIVLGVLITILVVFAFAWNIAGSVMVFMKWNDWYHDRARCHSDMFVFTFAYVILYWLTSVCYAKILWSKLAFIRNPRTPFVV